MEKKYIWIFNEECYNSGNNLLSIRIENFSGLKELASSNIRQNCEYNLSENNTDLNFYFEDVDDKKVVSKGTSIRIFEISENNKEKIKECLSGYVSDWVDFIYQRIGDYDYEYENEFRVRVDGDLLINASDFNEELFSYLKKSESDRAKFVINKKIKENIILERYISQED